MEKIVSMTKSPTLVYIYIYSTHTTYIYLQPTVFNIYARYLIAYLKLYLNMTTFK